MRKVRMTQEERINAKVIAMRAHRRSVQRKKAIPAIVTAVCALAFLAGGSALGISLINNTKPAEKPQTVQATVPAKNAQNTQNTAKTMNVNTNNANTNYAQDTMPTYDESTNSYSYSFNGYENNDYSNDENFSLDTIQSLINTVQALIQVMLDIIVDDDDRQFHRLSLLSIPISLAHLSFVGNTKNIHRHAMMAR